MTLLHGTHPARVLVVAAAGYGKSTRLESELPDEAVRLPAADALAALDVRAASSWVAVDDLDTLPISEQVAVVDRLAALPLDVGVVVAARAPLAEEVRRRFRGPLLERGPADLALQPPEVARVLAEQYAVSDPELALHVHRVTWGWPALVHLVGDAVARAGHSATVPEGGLGNSVMAAGVEWLQREVLSGIPCAVRQVLGAVAALGPLDEALWDRIARVHGLQPGQHALAALTTTGLVVTGSFVEDERLRGVVPLLAQEAGHDPAAHRAAARHYEERGLWFHAARNHAAVGDDQAVDALVAGHGDEMVGQGHARGVTELYAGRPAAEVSPHARLVLGDALRMTGRPDAALRMLRGFAPPRPAPWAPGLSRRVAMVHFLTGDFPAAAEALAQTPEPVGEDADSVEWWGCRAQVEATVGNAEQAARSATAALAAAETTGTRLAAAHLAAARVSAGLRKDVHLELALGHARAAGDLGTVARVLTNQAHALLAAGRYADAVPVTREAARLADQVSPPGLRIAALHNLGEALARTGEYDEARWQLHRAVALGNRLGAARGATALLGLADVHRELDRVEQAAEGYREIVELVRAPGELQVLVPALAGLARSAPLSAAARAAVVEADELATGPLQVHACLAGAAVAAAAGERDEAYAQARRAVTIAREHGIRDLLGEALETLGASSPDPQEAAAALHEALAIWAPGGALCAAARVEVLLGALPGAPVEARLRGREAARRLLRLGVGQVHGRTLDVAGGSRSVRIQVLGGFAVTVEGRDVPLTAWRSRQARTLVKLLASRRGRPWPRGTLCELLWPDDDPARTGHRLSVLLTTVRAVLDPRRRWPADRYVASDLTGVRLDLRHASVDADDVLALAEHAAELLEEGAEEQAEPVLVEVHRQYRGDAFEDDPYEQWADPLREEVRAAWLRCAGRLVRLRRRQGRVADAQALLVRMLATDPYDEVAHRTLVRMLAGAGRHGEARRALERWTAAMRSIDAPAPPPAYLRSDATLTRRRHDRALITSPA